MRARIPPEIALLLIALAVATIAAALDSAHVVELPALSPAMLDCRLGPLIQSHHWHQLDRYGRVECRRVD